MPEIAEVKLANCRFEITDFRKNCDCGIEELRLRSNIPSKVAELPLRKFFLQVAELRLRTPEKVARAHLWYGDVCISVGMYVCVCGDVCLCFGMYVCVWGCVYVYWDVCTVYVG
jgi:hypothetical protein